MGTFLTPRPDRGVPWQCATEDLNHGPLPYQRLISPVVTSGSGIPPGDRVLRSGDRPGIEQKLRALLTRCQLLRMAMVTAVETRPGTDPDRASFTSALEAARGVCPDGPAGLPRRHRPRRAGQPAARPHRLRCSPQGQC